MTWSVPEKVRESFCESGDGVRLWILCADSSCGSLVIFLCADFDADILLDLFLARRPQGEQQKNPEKKNPQIFLLESLPGHLPVSPHLDSKNHRCRV